MFLLLFIFAVGAAIYYFARDSYIEVMLEDSLAPMAEAKVEIDNFRLSLLSLECGWDRLQVADKRNPMKNILETDRARLKLELRPLFWGKIIIEEMALQNVRSSSPRTTSGYMEFPVDTSSFVADVQESIENQLGELPVFDLAGLSRELKIDSLIDVNKLQSVQGYKTLYRDADSTFGHWDKKLKQANYLAEIKSIEAEIKKLPLSKMDKMKPLELAALAKDIQKLSTRLDGLKKNLEADHRGAKSAFADLQGQLKDAQKGLKRDIERAKAAAKLKDLDVRDIALLLFGDPVVQNVEDILYYIDLARTWMPVATALLEGEEDDAPERFAGKDIHFPFHRRYPEYLIRRVVLSGTTAGGDTSRGNTLEGVVTGLTTQPSVYGRPTRLKIKFGKNQGNKYALRAVFNHVGKVAQDSIWVSAKDFKMGQIKLKESTLLPHAMHAQKGDLNFSGVFVGDGMSISGRLQASPVKFSYRQENGGRLAKAVRQILDGLKMLDLSVAMKGQNGKYGMRLSSNVDNAFSKGVKNMLSQNVRAAQDKITSYVTAESQKGRAKVNALYARYRTETNAKLDNVYALYQEQVQKVNKYKKDVQDRIDAEKEKARKAVEDQKSKLKDKAKSKIGNLLKKKN